MASDLVCRDESGVKFSARKQIIKAIIDKLFPVKQTIWLFNCWAVLSMCKPGHMVIIWADASWSYIRTKHNKKGIWGSSDTWLGCPQSTCLWTCFKHKLMGGEQPGRRLGAHQDMLEGLHLHLRSPRGEVEGARRGKGDLNCCARPAATAILTRIIST